MFVLDTVTSTNDEALRRGRDGAPSGTVVLAAEQTAGRGRMGRRWHSPRGPGLYVSVLLRSSRPARELSRWSIAAAVSACKACRDATGADLVIEWPNDVMWRGRKVAGILVESRCGGERIEAIVIGVGFNVRHQPETFPPELAPRAVSLEAAAAGAVDPPHLVASYLGHLARESEALESGDWESVRVGCMALAPRAEGAPVRVARGGGSPDFVGITHGLDERGALRVRGPDGTVVGALLGESVTYLGG